MSYQNESVSLKIDESSYLAFLVSRPSLPLFSTKGSLFEMTIIGGVGWSGVEPVDKADRVDMFRLLLSPRVLEQSLVPLSADNF